MAYIVRYPLPQPVNLFAHGIAIDISQCFHPRRHRRHLRVHHRRPLRHRPGLSDLRERGPPRPHHIDCRRFRARVVPHGPIGEHPGRPRAWTRAQCICEWPLLPTTPAPPALTHSARTLSFLPPSPPKFSNFTPTRTVHLFGRRVPRQRSDYLPPGPWGCVLGRVRRSSP